MRLMVIVVNWVVNAGRDVGGYRNCNSLQRLRVMRGHTHRSHKCKSTLHRQQAAKHNNDQIADARVHALNGNTNGCQAITTVISSTSNHHST